MNRFAIFFEAASVHHSAISQTDAKVYYSIALFPDCANLRSPQYLDGWAMPKSFIVQLGESPFCSSATWKMIWEQQVRYLIITSTFRH